MPTGDVENLIVGAGYIYHAAIGTTEPEDDQVHEEPSSASWSNLGFTDGGVSLTYSPEFFQLAVDQLVDPIGQRLTAREFVISTNLAEATLDNFQKILNGGTLATGTAGSGVSFQSFTPEVDPTGAPTYFMVIFDGFAPGGFARRVILRKTLQVGEIGQSYTKDGQTMYPVQFKAHYVDSTTAPFKIIDQTAAEA